MEQKDKRTIVYARESRDDFGENYERIETQRDILIDYCKREGLTNIVEVILDDNVSGTSFKRLHRVLGMAENRQFDVIVFKDASRLGRNLRESLNFMFQLEELDIEVLFESEVYDEAMFPLLAWFNEQRAREDSKKVRRVFQHKMQSGELLIKGAYGYDKVDKDLVINEEAAAVVRRVFQLTLEGHGALKIATMFNCENIPTPSQFQYAQDKRGICTIWNRQHIYRILTNRIYTGDMIYAKRTKKSFKSNKVIAKPEEEWIVVKGHHEPIIPMDTFDKVQAIRKKNKARRTAGLEPSLYAGLLVCGRCGYQLVVRDRKNRKRAYICAKNHREGSIKDHIRPDYGCRSHHIREVELTELTNQFLRTLIDGDDDFVLRALNLYTAYSETRNEKKQVAELKKSAQNYERIIEKVYDDQLNAKLNLPQSVFEKKLNEYTQKLNETLDKISALDNIGIQPGDFDVAGFTQAIESFLHSGLKNHIMKCIFDRIIYYLPGEITEDVKSLYGLSEEAYSALETKGGFLFKLNTIVSDSVKAG